MADESTGSGAIVAMFAIVVLGALVVLFFIYGLPRMQSAKPDALKVDVTLPDVTPQTNNN